MIARCLAAGVLLFGVARATAAQQAQPSNARCDSIVGAARVDTISSGLFLSARRADGGELSDTLADFIVAMVGSSFVVPTPFALSVFSGPARMRTLQPVLKDTGAVLRAPTVTGIYRVSAMHSGTVSNVKTLRASLMRGLDSAVATAIEAAGKVKGTFVPPNDDDSMRVDIRLSSDSTAGARRIVSASFPRLRIVDAVPKRDNPAAPFPEDEAQDSVTAGEVVLRFVVDRDGEPALETIEIVRASSWSFVRSALNALPEQLFEPARVNGCAVAQVIDYPFSFVLKGERSGFRR